MGLPEPRRTGKKRPDDDLTLLDAVDTLLRSERFGEFCMREDIYEIWDKLETFRVIVKTHGP